MKHEAMMQHESASHAGGAAGAPRRAGHDAHSHHAHMVADFRRRFWISLALTVPILAISEHFWALMGLRPLISFAGDRYALFAFASIVYFYGGWPFLTGAGGEIVGRKPGMMLLIAVAISAAFFYSVAVTFGLAGAGFYWELATLIDVMLLGHWIEMRSVMGASGALESLVRMMPSEAHRLRADGSTEDVTIDQLARATRCWSNRVSACRPMRSSWLA